MSEQYVAAIDQGTASSRCMVFDRSARIVSVAQKEHHQIFPRPGWVEHDPEEIWRNVEEVVQRRARPRPSCSPPTSCALGIANQRETTLRVGPRDRRAGAQRDQLAGHAHRPRSCRELAGDAGQDRFRERCGLPLATYFSGPKLRWLLDTVPGPARARRGRRGAVRDDGLVADLEAHRAPRDRRDQRQPDDADGPRHARLGRRAARRDGRPAGDAARDPPVGGDLRRGARAAGRRARSPPRSATSRRRCSGRPASAPARPSAPTAPAASCCSTPASDRSGRPAGC